MADTMYSAEEAAQILGLQVRTVRNHVREGRLPGVRIGKQYRIARADLEAFTAGGLMQQTLLASERAGETPRPSAPEVEVSSVVQIDSLEAAACERLERTLEVAALSDEPGSSPLRWEPIYDEERQRLKIIIVGPVARVAELLRIVDALTAERR